LAWKAGVEPAWSQEVHTAGESRHVRHVELHEAHVEVVDGTRYSPCVHVYVHVPAAESKVPPSRQAVQPVAVASVHSVQLASQATQVEAEFGDVPEGQEDTHAPPS